MRLGKAADENPELPAQFLIDLLLAIQEVKEGKLASYIPGE